LQRSTPPISRCRLSPAHATLLPHPPPPMRIEPRPSGGRCRGAAGAHPRCQKVVPHRRPPAGAHRQAVPGAVRGTAHREAQYPGPSTYPADTPRHPTPCHWMPRAAPCPPAFPPSSAEWWKCCPVLCGGEMGWGVSVRACRSTQLENATFNPANPALTNTRTHVFLQVAQPPEPRHHQEPLERRGGPHYPGEAPGAGQPMGRDRTVPTRQVGPTTLASSHPCLPLLPGCPGCWGPLDVWVHVGRLAISLSPYPSHTRAPYAFTHQPARLSGRLPSTSLGCRLALPMHMCTHAGPTTRSRTTGTRACGSAPPAA
jgi:hypothetical protein